MPINFSSLKRKQVRMTIQTEDKDNPIEIYEPNNEQREMILDIIGKNVSVDENNLKTQIKDEDFLLILLGELTNIYLDLDKEKDTDLIKEILEDPSSILLRVKLEIDKLVNEIFRLWYETIKEISKTPEELKEALLLKLSQNNKEETDEEKRLRELEEEINQIKSKKAK